MLEANDSDQGDLQVDNLANELVEQVASSPESDAMEIVQEQSEYFERTSNEQGQSSNSQDSRSFSDYDVEMEEDIVNKTEEPPANISDVNNIIEDLL